MSKKQNSEKTTRKPKLKWSKRLWFAPEETTINIGRKNALFISDLQFPYTHPDYLEFLKAVAKKYDCKAFFQVGDLFDNHTLSTFGKKELCLGQKNEYDKAIEMLHELGDHFKQVHVCFGNHDERLYRKTEQDGYTSSIIKEMSEWYQLPKKWTMTEKVWINYSDPSGPHAPGKGKILMIHGHQRGVKDMAHKYNTYCVVKGHFHSELSVIWFASQEAIRWSMTTGCLVDDKNAAYSYNSPAITNKFILGCGVLFKGRPVVVDMTLNKEGRWTGKI